VDAAGAAEVAEPDESGDCDDDEGDEEIAKVMHAHIGCAAGEGAV
jgi:hypothetical protein